MRNVISNVFKRSTLSFMSLVLAFSTLAPVLSIQTASAATAPLSADVACVDEKVVLTVTARQASLPNIPATAEGWGTILGLNVITDNIKYTTDYGAKTQDLPAGDVDVYTVNTGQESVGDGNVSANVTGWYYTKKYVNIFGIPVHLGGYDTHLYNTTLDAPYSALNCDVTAPTAPTDLAWTADGGTAQVTGGITNQQTGELSWVNSDSDTDHYNYYFWTDIPGYYEGQANAWPKPDVYTVASESIWTDFYDKEGTYFFCVEAVDENGNISACSDVYSIVYDKTAPTAAIVDHTFAVNVVTPEVTATDANGIASYLWTPVGDAGANVDVSDVNVIEPEFTANADGIYTFNLTVTDNAGNETTVPFEFTYKAPVVKDEVVIINNGGSLPSATPARLVQPAVIFGISNNATVAEEKVAAIGAASRDTAGDVAGVADDKDSKGCGIFLGICWYYWIPIVIAIVAAAYAVRRRLQANNV